MGYTSDRYWQFHMLNSDTGSTVELVCQGWHAVQQLDSDYIIVVVQAVVNGIRVGHSEGVINF